MFRTILKWLLDGGRPRTDALAARETYEGEEILLLSARRVEILAEIKDLVIRIPRARRRDLVDRVAARFALYVVDLPASERSHDREPYGLLDHSLEVALSVTRELVRPSFRVSEDPVANYREQPIWGYAGMLLGLLHDAGKIFDLDVVLSEGGAPWNPDSEPLLSFLRRSGRTRSGAESWRWKRGRGLNTHVRRTEALTPHLLPVSAQEFLGSRLEELLRVFARSYECGKEDLPAGPATQAVLAVRRADRMHAERASSQKTEEAKPKEKGDSDPPGEERVAGTFLGGDPPEAIGPLVEAPAEPEGAPEGGPSEADRAPKARAGVEKSGYGNRPRKEGRGPKQYVLKPPVSKRDRWIQDELHPAKLIESIRSWIRSGNVSRNSHRAEVLVRQDYLWLRYPDALTSFVEHRSMTWSAPLAERLLAVLLQCREVDPENPRSALVYAFPELRDKKPSAFVRLRAKDFLPENELAGLGYWPSEMRVQPTAIPRHPELPFQGAQGRRL
jgi:hypothetical protein